MAKTSMMLETQGLLINLIEEAAEVSQIAAKCLRFGMESYHPDDEKQTENSELLAVEIGNFLHIVGLLKEDCLVNDYILRGKRQKKKRLAQYPLIIGDE